MPVLHSMNARRDLLARSKTVVLVGASANPTRPSYFVFSYLRTKHHFTIAPINPALTEIDGIQAYPSLAAYALEHGSPDIVDIFRKPTEAPQITREAIAIGAKAIWFQYGVINEEAVALADAAGLDVVVDRCIKVESARFDGGLTIGGMNSGIISSRRATGHLDQ
jgi:uncharacterized protein